MPHQKRQLAAIMFTDIVGYTSLMGKDETAAYQLLKKNRKVQRPIIEKYGGKWLKELGDGVLASFNTISEAIYCAIEIQRKCTKEPDLKLRIGIHLGEVIAEEGDVFGDGVNIASRLEPLAPPGGIYVSESIYRNIQNKKGIKAEYVSEETLKNVDHAIKIYEIDAQGSMIVTPDIPTLEAVSEVKTSFIGWIKPVFIFLLILIIIVTTYLVYNNLGRRNDTTEISEQKTREKSIAVLPFVNMSNDPDQDYFSDGIMEEILIHLYKIGDLQVTSRTSVMKYKGTSKSIPEIAHELGVSSLLEGSVRKSGNRVRIAVQLIDGQTDKPLWSESYDRELEDIFSIQSEVAMSIATTLKIEIQPEVEERISSQPTNNIEAYDLYLESLRLKTTSKDENEKALNILNQVIKLDPNFSRAYDNIGSRLQTGALLFPTDGGLDPRKAWIISKPYIDKALMIDPDNGIAHIKMAQSLLYFEWDFEGAGLEYMEAKRIFPNYTFTDYLIAMGYFNKAAKEAENIKSNDPYSGLIWSRRILSSYFIDNQEKALLNIKNALKDTQYGRDTLVYSYAAASRVYMYLEKYNESLRLLKIINNIQPDIRSPRLLAIQAISAYNLNNINLVSDIIEELKEISLINAGGSPSFYLAMIYAEMGDINKSFNWLEKSYQDHEVEMYWLKVEPPFKPLHNDPRWQVMLDKVGFPD